MCVFSHQVHSCGYSSPGKLTQLEAQVTEQGEGLGWASERRQVRLSRAEVMGVGWRRPAGVREEQTEHPVGEVAAG